MTNAANFRDIALSFPNVEEGKHAGQPDFRIGGRKFATLASIDEGYGNLPLTTEIQAAFVADAPEIFIPIRGGFGRMGHTHIVLAKADHATLAGALRASYNLRVERNVKPKKKAAPNRK
ncbi:MAG: MmcQ/YjbR family DNA-binding protein [Acidobacteriaceae bacterium]